MVNNMACKWSTGGKNCSKGFTQYNMCDLKGDFVPNSIRFCSGHKAKKITKDGE